MNKPNIPIKSTIGIIVVCLAAIGIVVYLALRPMQPDNQVIGETFTGQEAAALDLNKGEVIDAIENRDVQAREGFRYRVIIDDESKQGSSGIAHIGGLVTFVADSRPGEELIVEVTRIKMTVAEAVVVERLGMREIPKRQSYDRGPTTSIDGKAYFATVGDVGKKGDGILKVSGKVVFVPDVKVGESVWFVIVEDRDSYARGRVITEEKVTELGLEMVKTEQGSGSAGAPSGGKQYTATVEDIGKKGDGLVHIEGKVVFLPGTKVGDEVIFEITQERENFSIGRVVGSGGTAASPSAGRVRGSSEAVQPGEVYEVEVTEKDRKNPETGGVARIEGLVVLIPDTRPGDKVKIKITDRARNFARGEVIEKLPAE